MQLNEFIVSRGYEILQCFDYEGHEAFRLLDGSSRRATWEPLPVRRVRYSRRVAFRPSDSPYCGGEVLIFRRSAIDVLQDILDAHGELLPLKDEGGVELYAYNPRALDCFDQVLSKGPRDDDGRLEAAIYPIFIPSVVDGVDVFRYKKKRNGEIFVSDRFVERWKKAKLKGLDFKMVWDSELPPDKQPRGEAQGKK